MDIKGTLKKTKIYHMLRKPYMILFHNYAYIPKQINARTAVFGNDYGGFPVAVNSLPPRGDITVYSFGIGEDLSFSEDLLTKYDERANIYAFDPTPKAQKYVQAHHLSTNSNFHFFPYGLSDHVGFEKFYLPKNKDFVSASVVLHDGVDAEDAIDVPMKTLPQIMGELGHTHIDILKMDIEGSEFKVIPQILSEHCDISQICCEIHGYLFANGKKLTKDLIRIMNEAGYYVAKVRDSAAEVLFIKRD